MVNQTQTSSKPRARTDTEEARELVTSLLTSLHPTYTGRTITLDLPISGTDQTSPTLLRGNRMLVRSHIASLYQAGVMPIASFNYALSSLVTRLKKDWQETHQPITILHKERVQGHSNLYIVPGEGICIIKVDRDGNEVLTHIWDSLPIVHYRYVVPTAISGYELQYELQIGKDRHTVSSDELRTHKWISKFPSVSGVLSDSKHGQYIDAISQIALQAPIKFGLEATGWYNIGDEQKQEWIYLQHDGRYISADGLVHAANTGKVELRKQILGDNELELWKSHQVTTQSTADEHKAAIAFLSHLTSHSQTLFELGQAVSAMLYDVRNSHYGVAHTLASVGKAGSGKTARAGLVRCLVYPYRRRPLPDATFNDTVTSIELRLADRRSVPVFIDDLPEEDYSKPGKKAEYDKKIDSLVRTNYNESPVRQRATSKLQQQKANIIKTAPLHTYEVIPDVGTSCLRRMLISTVADGEVQTDSTTDGDIALDQIPEYVPAINNIGYRLAVFIAQLMNKHTKDGLAMRLLEKQQAYEQSIRVSVRELWQGKHDGLDVPSELSSLAENAAYVLVALHIVDQVTLYDSNLVEAVYQDLVNLVYDNLARIAGISLDCYTGLDPLETAIQAVFNTIADSQHKNGSIWQVEQYTSQALAVTPKAYRPDSTKIPVDQWGERHATDYSLLLPVAYFDEQVTYLTRTFREALKAEYNQLPGSKPLTSDKALTQLLDRSGWLDRLNSKSGTRDIYPHGKRIYHALALRNDKLFKLLGIARLDPVPETVAAREGTTPVPKAIDEALDALDQDPIQPELPSSNGNMPEEYQAFLQALQSPKLRDRTKFFVYQLPGYKNDYYKKDVYLGIVNKARLSDDEAIRAWYAHEIHEQIKESGIFRL